MKEQIKVAVAGLGEFGSQIVKWIQDDRMHGVQIIYCIEPDKRRWVSDLPCYDSLDRIPHNLLSTTSLVVDCSSKGKGVANIDLYRHYGIPAVFQNGEGVDLCQLFHAWMIGRLKSSYLKIARCSALSTCAVARPIMEIAEVKDIWACHFKVNMRDCMLDMNYESGTEIAMLLGVPARVDVVYLRGTSHSGYAYHGFVQFECAGVQSRNTVLQALAESKDITTVHQEIDTLTYPRTTQTLVIEEGVEVRGSIIRVAVLSFTPEINFPQNEKAIRLLAQTRVVS